MKAKWTDFLKTAQEFVDGERKFILGRGNGLLHVVNAWNYARGLYKSETGNRYYFDPKTLTNIVQSARTSQ